MSKDNKYKKKYDDENTIQIKLKLNLKTDADILSFLEASGNKQGTIKSLIRNELKNREVNG